MKLKRAIISCYDKKGLIELGAALQKQDVEILSTAGTLKHLQENNIAVKDISEISERGEAFGGRIKSLSFGVSAGLLFDRVSDAQEAQNLGVKSIDLVVCNLYPFDQASQDDFVRWIDIGGPTMLRAASKNYEFVSVLCDPKNYANFIEELEKSGGTISLETRKHLMRKTFSYMADYDCQISTALDKWAGEDSLRLSFSNKKPLRYGENSHQKADYFESTSQLFMKNMQVHQGKELSYNNLLDVQAAFDAIRDLKNQACCIIKHCTPCGIAQSSSQVEAFKLAWASDPVSAFGSIVVFSSVVDKQTVEQFSKKFVEIIAAPSFSHEALELLRTQKNLRVITYDPNIKASKQEIRLIDGGALVQERDLESASKREWVTDCHPALDAGSSAGSRLVGRDDKQARGDNMGLSDSLLEFGLHCIRPMKSNAIALVRTLENGSFQLLGMGCGQPNRIHSVKLAVERATDGLTAEYQGHPSEQDAYIQHHLSRAVLISEAFFPFSDSIDVCHEAGIKTIVQPGGSMRDKQVIEACNQHGISMMFVGNRHFKH
ncbi:MAG: bifunctional phosphoribosylaminoimidazolecarboxamide formyltransferase/IMP cyclohydrolase [Deltaproteobacteria bacterium]|nr:bifunctional phosphoribosylaminoimidazolecarboxamide formyltransferase/IMP cyclohydrolase [Deltaproteobacteria bacterium]